MRFTQEHQYGTEVHLWREGADLFGLLFYSGGRLIGDPPTGLLEDIRYDSKTGAISFVSKLTTGQHFCKVHKDVPAHDLFSFNGKLSEYSLSGVLTRSDALHPENPPTVEEQVMLKKTSGAITDHRSRADWEAMLKKTLKFRGPKW